MRIPDGISDWQTLYEEDVAAAENELVLNHLDVAPDAVLGDIYVLPPRRHQTFYAKLVLDRFFKIVSVKALQNSVWFSDPIYDYSISEAKRFENHPKRCGRLICRSELINRHFIAAVDNALSRLAEHQPEGAVIPSENAALTVIRTFIGGEVARRICYTDASKLAFKDGDTAEAADFLNNLWLEIEKKIGIGE